MSSFADNGICHIVAYESSERNTSEPNCPKDTSNKELTESGINAARLSAGTRRSTTPIAAHGVCRYLDAPDATTSYFVPFRSAEEYNHFLAHPPADVDVAACCPSRALSTTDVPRPAAQCISGSWKLLGLLNPSNLNNYLAITHRDGGKSKTFLKIKNVTETAAYPISNLPRARDDVNQLATTNNQNYIARFECLTHKAAEEEALYGKEPGATTVINDDGKTIAYVEFQLACKDAAWRTELASSAQCVSSSTAGVEPCTLPNTGQNGLVSIIHHHVCDGSNDGKGFDYEVIQGACVPFSKQSQSDVLMGEEGHGALIGGGGAADRGVMSGLDSASLTAAIEGATENAVANGQAVADRAMTLGATEQEAGLAGMAAFGGAFNAGMAQVAADFGFASVSEMSLSIAATIGYEGSIAAEAAGSGAKAEGGREARAMAAALAAIEAEQESIDENASTQSQIAALDLASIAELGPGVVQGVETQIGLEIAGLAQTIANSLEGNNGAYGGLGMAGGGPEAAAGGAIAGGISPGAVSAVEGSPVGQCEVNIESGLSALSTAGFAQSATENSTASSNPEADSNIDGEGNNQNSRGDQDNNGNPDGSNPDGSNPDGSNPDGSKE